MKGHVSVVKPKAPSAFGRILKNSILVCITLVLTWILSILIEWGGMWTLWKDQGVTHSRQVLEQERKYLNFVMRYKKPSLIKPAHRKQINSWLQFGFEVTFIKTGLLAYVGKMAAASPTAGRYTSNFIDRSRPKLVKHIEAAGNVTQTFGNRLTILVLSLPLFLIVGIVAVSNGLVERYKRIVGVGREYATRFHYLIPEMKAGICLPWILYLSLPISINPNYIILPFVAYFGFMLFVVSFTIKKHI